MLLGVAIDLAKYIDQSFVSDVWRGPVAFAAFFGNVVAVASEIAQEAVVETGRFERVVEVVVDRRIMREDLMVSRFLLPSRNSSLRY